MEPSDQATYSYQPLSTAEAERFRDMTFPRYRGLLADSATRVVAVGAFQGTVPAGLILAEVHPQLGEQQGTLRSVFVAREHRRRGVASRLLDAVEQASRQRGVATLTAVYSTGTPSTPAVERLVTKCDWSPPATRAIIARFNADVLNTPLMRLLSGLNPPFTVVPWTSLTDADRASVERSHAVRPWIPPDLIPSRWESGLECRTSMALRHGDNIVGWLLNHELDAATLRLSCGWVRPDLTRIRRSIPLLALARETLIRGREMGYQHYVWLTSAHQTAMTTFSRRRLAPYTESFRETRGTSKGLR